LSRFSRRSAGAFIQDVSRRRLVVPVSIPKLRLERRRVPQTGASILSVGDDIQLLWTRHMVLESERYWVRSGSSGAFLNDDEVYGADLAVICHSVKEPRMSQVTASLRRMHPLLPILRLTLEHASRRDAWDNVLSIEDGPLALLDTVRRMVFDATSEV
jgi:hypothetical protein